MDWLGASLAFATTMLALSVVVTSTVETIHRIFRLREKGMDLMLGAFFDAALKPHVERTSTVLNSGQLKSTLVADRTSFVDEMTRNRAPGGERLLSWGTKGGAKDQSGFVSRIWNGRRIAALALDDFMGRLGDSAFGEAVAGLERDLDPRAVDTVLRDLAHKFDEFGRDTSVYFEARARLLSVIVALVLAWQAYVHPYVLFSTFLKNPAIAESVNKMADTVLREYDEARKKLDDTLAKVDTEAPAADHAAKVQEDERALQSTAKETLAKLDTLTRAGVPIGWSGARLAKSDFGEVGGILVYPHLTATGLTTVAWLLLGGLLVGLGGPFWRDLVLSLTNMRGRAESEKRKGEGVEDVAGVNRITAATERFLTASRARAAVTGDLVAVDETEVPVG